MTNIYNVSFPHLGIYLKINPIALQLSNFRIYWYGIILAAGFILAFLYVNRRCGHFGIRKTELPDLIFAATVCSIVCARLYYVLFYPGDFYIKHPINIFFISEGGIAIYGAVIGGFIGIYAYSKIKNKDIKTLSDLMVLGLLIGQIIGRWGNFINQEAFGMKTNLPWGMLSEQTSGETVHPCFLYESLGCLLIFIFLHIYSTRIKTRQGHVFLLYILFYGILRTLIESLRTDSLMIPLTGIRVSQAIGVLTAVVAAVLLLFQNYKYNKSKYII